MKAKVIHKAMIDADTHGMLRKQVDKQRRTSGKYQKRSFPKIRNAYGFRWDSQAVSVPYSLGPYRWLRATDASHATRAAHEHPVKLTSTWHLLEVMIARPANRASTQRIMGKQCVHHAMHMLRIAVS